MIWCKTFIHPNASWIWMDRFTVSLDSTLTARLSPQGVEQVSRWCSFGGTFAQKAVFFLPLPPKQFVGRERCL